MSRENLGGSLICSSGFPPIVRLKRGSRSFHVLLPYARLPADFVHNHREVIFVLERNALEPLEVDTARGCGGRQAEFRHSIHPFLWLVRAWYCGRAGI